MTLSNEVPFVIGHRGAAGLAPENTLAGIRRARDAGVTWVEFDVMLSADAQPMLIHDDDVARTTDGKGAVNNFSHDELAALDAGAWFGTGFAGERIPTFAEAVALLVDLQMGANVEIKPYPGREVITAEVVCAWIGDYWPADVPGPVVSSFSMEAMAVAQRMLPRTERALLFFGLPKDWRSEVERLDARAVHLDNGSTTQAVAAAMAEAGLPLRVYTINDPHRARELRDWGISSVFTDRPDLIRL